MKNKRIKPKSTPQLRRNKPKYTSIKDKTRITNTGVIEDIDNWEALRYSDNNLDFGLGVLVGLFIGLGVLCLLIFA